MAKKRRPRRKPSRLDNIERDLGLITGSIVKLQHLPAVMAEMSADKSRLGFLQARNPELEHQATGLRAVIREHENTIARFTEELLAARAAQKGRRRRK